MGLVGADGRRGELRLDPSTNVDAGDFQVRIKGPPLVLDLDARRLVDASSAALLAHLRDAIEASRDPGTGRSHPPLKRRAREAPGRLGDRGYRTGLLADEIARTAVRGSSTRARTLIEPPPERIAYVKAEAKRGTRLLASDGAAGAVLSQAVAEFGRGVFDARARGRVDGGAKKAREAK